MRPTITSSALKTAALAGAALTCAAIVGWTMHGGGSSGSGQRAASSTTASLALEPSLVRREVREAPPETMLTAPLPPVVTESLAAGQSDGPASDEAGAAPDEPAPDAAALEAAQSRKVEREAAAISTLRSIAAAQLQLQLSSAIDTDADGRGEYGYLAELAGTRPMRKHDVALGATNGGPKDLLQPPYLADTFGKLESVGGFGAVLREGYYFQVHLPDAASERPIGALGEAPAGGSDFVLPGSNHAEVMWSCYAWPAEASEPPMRAFFINQEGAVVACEGDWRNPAPYVGKERTPRFDAALSNAMHSDMTQPVGLEALEQRANDGHLWIAVEN